MAAEETLRLKSQYNVYANIFFLGEPVFLHLTKKKKKKRNLEKANLFLAKSTAQPSFCRSGSVVDRFESRLNRVEFSAQIVLISRKVMYFMGLVRRLESNILASFTSLVQFR